MSPLLAALLLAAGSAPSPDPAVQIQERAEAGVRVRFEIAPAAGSGALREGENAALRFVITDEGGLPLTGLRPAAWMDPRRTAEAPDDALCEKTIQSWLQPSLGAQPAVDLGGYDILTLDDGPSISVLDPVRGLGTSRLLTRVLLDGPGEDWVLSPDRERLFVSVPQAREIAVVSTATWKIVSRMEAGARPGRMALQPDGRYLWVSNAGATVTVLDAIRLRRVAEIRAGAGPHQFAFSGDGRHAFVAARGAGAVSVIEVRTLRGLREVRTGKRPISIAHSALSESTYVAHEGGGIAVLDVAGRVVSARLSTPPGLAFLRISPDGRWIFAVNRGAGAVHVFDARSDRLSSTIPVGMDPDQVSFTDRYAYVRSLGTERVAMIPLAQLAKGEFPAVSEIPGGQLAPGPAQGRSPAAAIVAGPEPGSALIANPADGLVYYYSEGMAAPMGSFANGGRRPRAVLAADRGLRETAPGVYAGSARLPAGGIFDVGFLLDSPRVVRCFEAKVSPDLRRAPPPATVVPLFAQQRIALGAPLRMRFGTGGAPRQIADLEVMVLLASGRWHRIERALPLGDGTYEATARPPRPGLYYVRWRSASLGLRAEEVSGVVVQVLPEEKADVEGR